MSASSDRIIEVFSQAKARAPGEERERFLAEACRGDAELRKQVDSILQADASASDFLQKTQVVPVPAVATEKPGDRIGHYKLLEKIGEGGMGTVWMAEQLEPVRRRVALKVIKQGLDSRQVLARFEAERQALALMDHPNIAKIFDAGVTGYPLTPSLSPIGGEGARRAGEGVAVSLAPSGGEGRGEGSANAQLSTFISQLAAGRSYFVMELVKGIPITQFCDEQRLSIRERLDLFIPVCQAIQHAHQKGIIHRDIKPSNVMVALYDGKPVPKVIDFGLAKAIGQQLTERTLFTGFGALVGTLEYMSPEQAELNQLDVDTRSDIYSLGVLLYELLTGTTPLTRETLRQAAFDEVLRHIRETEPPRPSTRLSESKDRLPTISAQRKLDPSQLTKLVRGDLDWIVMKCLEKDRSRRYETANAIAQDIERHVRNEPVVARPPSALYRWQKFERRNRAAVAVAFGFLLLLASATVLSLHLAWRANQFAKDSEEQRQLASQEAFKAGSQFKRAEESLKLEATARREAERNVYLHQVLLAHQEWSNGRVDQAENILNGCAKDLRHWEWHYLWRLCHNETVRFRGHQKGLLAVAFSPDSQCISSVGLREVCLWDPSTGEESLHLTNQHGWASGTVYFSPEGKDWAGLATISPDGKRFCSVASNELQIVETATGNIAFTIPYADDDITCVRYSPDGNWIASGCLTERTSGEHGVVRLWDAQTGSHLRDIFARDDWITAMAFSPDSSLLASVGGAGSLASRKIRVSTTLSARNFYELAGHRSDVNDVAFSPDGNFLCSASADMTLKIWDLSAREALQTLAVPQNAVLCVAFSPDGTQIVSGDAGGSIRRWDIKTGRELARMGHSGRINSVAFSSDGRWIVSSAFGDIRIWNASADPTCETLSGHTNRVLGTAFSPDGRQFASASLRRVNGDQRLVIIQDTRTRRVLHRFASYGIGCFQHLAFSPDACVLAAIGPELSSVAGKMVGLVGENGNWNMWDLITGQTTNAQRPILAFSRDGNAAASLTEVWNPKTGKVISELSNSAPQVLVTAAGFSPDGSRMAVANTSGHFTAINNGRFEDKYDAERVKIWNAKSGALLFNWNSAAVAFSDDGKFIATSQRDTISLRAADDGKVLFTLRGHAKRVNSIAFSPDGRRLVSGSDDMSIRIWETTGGRQVLVLYGHSRPINSVAFSPNGRIIASGSDDQTVKFWEIGEVTLAAQATP